MTYKAHQISQLEQEREDLSRRLAGVMCGLSVMTPKALRLKARIDSIDARLERLKNPVSMPLSQVLPDNPAARLKIYTLLAKIPLAADLLYDILTDLKYQVKQLGVTEITFTDMIERVRRDVETIVKVIDDPQFTELFSMLSDDDPLVRDLTTILDRYLESHTPALQTIANRLKEGGEK